MIQVSSIPLSTATNSEYLVTITEKACRPYCLNSAARPSASVVFTVGSTTVSGGNAFATVTATVTVVTPSPNGCGCAKTQVFTETFDVAFNSADNNTISVTGGTAVVTEPSDIRCCKAYGVKVITSVTADVA